jgi:hypothetical protein
MDRHIPFFDSYWYCYANSAAMLLGASGFAVEPAKIEVLSGVGLGACIPAGGLPFFSSAAGLPDTGISRALEILGFAFEERAQEDGSAPPFDWLASRLASGPVVAGPLDMSLLRYNPGRPPGGGVDHYVLVSALDATNVRVHDPAGYAGVSLSRDLFAEAWRASTIAYRRGAFRAWCAPRRVHTPSDTAIRQDAIAWFKDLYRQSMAIAAEHGWVEGEAVIRDLARRARDGALSPAQCGHLRFFALPLGAKRALHFSEFFDAIGADIAALKRHQAGLFGDCHSRFMQDDTAGMADSLDALAACEARLRDAVLAL